MVRHALYFVYLLGGREGILYAAKMPIYPKEVFCKMSAAMPTRS